jgi:hypothetical protein
VIAGADYKIDFLFNYVRLAFIESNLMTPLVEFPFFAISRVVLIRRLVIKGCGSEIMIGNGFGTNARKGPAHAGAAVGFPDPLVTAGAACRIDVAGICSGNFQELSVAGCGPE